MWIKQKRFDALVQEYGLAQKTMGVLMEKLTEFYSVDSAGANFYTSKSSQVTEIHRKYKGIAAYGNQILQRLINLRVAFSVPNRLFLIKNPITNVADAQIKNAKQFLNDFMMLNGLDSSLPRDLCKESELEGQIAVRLIWDSKLKLPKLKYLPASTVSYKIEPEEQFTINSKLLLKLTDTEQKAIKKGSIVSKMTAYEALVLKHEDFSFTAFNDKLNSYDGWPTCGGILKTIENLDKDLLDWRKLNHLFAHPTPHFKCETEEEAQAINEMIKTVGWKVGTAIATNSDFQLKGPTGAEGVLLMNSIQTGAKIISGHTGIGIHFLGFANVMSNRATADSMGEPTEVVLHAEITGWQGFYTDLFVKAIEMRNKYLNLKLNSHAVLPQLTPLTDRQWRVVKDVFLPARDKGFISQETFLDKLPDIDAAAELNRIEEEEKKNKEKKKKEKDFERPSEGLQPEQGEQVLPPQNQNQPSVSRVPGESPTVGEFS